LCWFYAFLDREVFVMSRWATRTVALGVWIVLLVLIALAGAAGPAYADHDTRPIAVPRIGGDGRASTYPSTLNVVAPGGPSQQSQVGIELHAVTHPCPEHLAVLLVHNDTDKFLLMSNAGGCRPLQGTTIRFTTLGGTVALPDNEPAAPPHDNFIGILPSNYGAVPVFPAPAPPGPYTLSLPPANTLVHGTWRLYVMDTSGTHRGVIAGGWSLNYSTEITFHGHEEDVAIPGAGTGPGNALIYPIDFNLETVPASVTVTGVDLRLTMSHTLPDNLRILLQSPAGTSVVIMANAGGGADLDPGSLVRFTNNGVDGVVPDGGPIQTGMTNAHQPGGAYGSSIALGAPAPQPPYATSFDAFTGQPASGSWRLWIYDDAALNVGELESATLILRTDQQSGFTFVTPTASPLVSDQPFVRIEATMTDLLERYAIVWRNQANGEYYDAGAFVQRPGTNIVYADVPVKHGTNMISTYLHTTRASGVVFMPHLVNVNEMRYTLAEGATGSFFDADVTMANPSGVNTQIFIDFLPEGGAPLQVNTSVAVDTPLQVNVEDHVPAAAVSTVVRSRHAPLAVERTMTWDASGYGGHGGTSAAPSTRWLFAEGSQGYFSTYLLLANDNDTASLVNITFLVEGGAPVMHATNVPAKGRVTIDAGTIPELVNRSFGIDITAAQPIIAERAMYLPGARLFEGGHESAGVNAASRTWFLAEGATGPFFDCFVLMSNPNNVAANVELLYLLPDGTSIPQLVVVPANSRGTINVETVSPQLVNAAVSTSVRSDVEIVVERAMYWPDLSLGWQEAHNSFGVTDAGLRWGVADGRIGGSRAYQTYVLLANPNPIPAEVRVRFMKSGVATVRDYTLNPTSRVNIWVNNDVPELGEGNFSADIQVLNYQPIAVEKALYWNANGAVWAGGTNVTATRLPPP
jgi:subtilisin-like proprotein convertase family protein